MSRGQSAAKRSPIPPMNQKTGGQPNVCVIQPMIGANSTVAKYCAELKIALAVPRSAVGNHAAAIRLLAGNDGDSAAPRMKRNANKTTTAVVPESQPTKPCANVTTDQIPMLQP